MSRHTTDVIVQGIKGKDPFELDGHISQLTDIQNEASRVEEQLYSVSLKMFWVSLTLIISELF